MRARSFAYARERGIRVVPEFEMPGHSQAWQVAYPELASGKPPAGIRREFGVSAYALDPTREETYSSLSEIPWRDVDDLSRIRTFILAETRRRLLTGRRIRASRTS